ncbi:MAG TPA: PRC-barrel domain-containing protein [Candidatus Nanoarchaeia archaeon]|nr:PRC-barrel domain-containing protein [Candidatus Nanoarchaeia archaeon]
MLRIHKLNEIVGKHVYTSEGDYFGQIEEVSLAENKIAGWKIRVGGGFMSVLGGAKGVIIPHQFVKAIGDVFIVNRASLPVREEAGEVDVSANAATFSSEDSLEISKL